MQYVFISGKVYKSFIYNTSQIEYLWLIYLILNTRFVKSEYTSIILFCWLLTIWFNDVFFMILTVYICIPSFPRKVALQSRQITAEWLTILMAHRSRFYQSSVMTLVSQSVNWTPVKLNKLPFFPSTFLRIHIRKLQRFTDQKLITRMKMK